MKKITLGIIVGDNLLNWWLGIVLTRRSDWFEGLLASGQIMPRWVYVLIGVGFIAFAAWQVKTFVSNLQLPPPALRTAAILAWGPVVALTLALILPLSQPLFPWARTLLWAADAYMLILGGWYWWVASRLTTTANVERAKN